MEEEERERCGFVTINRPIDRPRPPANPSATVFINNVRWLIDNNNNNNCLAIIFVLH